ncbi:hypothetical protein HAX54_006069 [Datura stramonium]|uniref:Uncharacterized protein n=1 Tax=Datura stramonium TaxID=4076 RepID=A0ABS8TBD0_DATST|nr:hypothetical protein [Datura stramonium]
MAGVVGQIINFRGNFAQVGEMIDMAHQGGKVAEFCPTPWRGAPHLEHQRNGFNNLVKWKAQCAIVKTPEKPKHCQALCLARRTKGVLGGKLLILKAELFEGKIGIFLIL